MYINSTTNEYKSFYKTVGGGEGERCNYPTRLDLYGRGCQHNCSYCYSKSLLYFRNLWDNKNPAIADINKVKRKIAKIPDGLTIRLGGMTDCFQPIEKEVKNTYNAIKELNKQKKHYLIVTKSSMIANNDYINVLDKELAHIQISLTTTNDKLAFTYENASSPSERIEAIEKLQLEGFDVSLRLSPFIPEYIDYEIINNVRCDKILVEFLRVNTWIRRWFDIDYSPYTLKEGGYYHLPLEAKIENLKNITNFKEKSVCEDVGDHYTYWKESFNYNKDDCCNIKI